jgi:hypothetical protein
MEKLQDIVKSLPHMSKDIVDDTIHEKVLSYLSEYASQGPKTVAKFIEWNILDIIRVCNGYQIKGFNYNFFLFFFNKLVNFL